MALRIVIIIYHHHHHKVILGDYLKPAQINLGYESACRLLSLRLTIAIYSYYSARKLVLILSSHEG